MVCGDGERLGVLERASTHGLVSFVRDVLLLTVVDRLRVMQGHRHQTLCRMGSAVSVAPQMRHGSTNGKLTVDGRNIALQRLQICNLVVGHSDGTN